MAQMDEDTLRQQQHAIDLAFRTLGAYHPDRGAPKLVLGNGARAYPLGANSCQKLLAVLPHYTQYLMTRVPDVAPRILNEQLRNLLDEGWVAQNLYRDSGRIIGEAFWDIPGASGVIHAHYVKAMDGPPLQAAGALRLLVQLENARPGSSKHVIGDGQAASTAWHFGHLIAEWGNRDNVEKSREIDAKMDSRAKAELVRAWSLYARFQVDLPRPKDQQEKLYSHLSIAARNALEASLLEGMAEAFENAPAALLRWAAGMNPGAHGMGVPAMAARARRGLLAQQALVSERHEQPTVSSSPPRL
jgi:hypothetical protein